MSRFANMNALSLSWKLLRSGSTSFQQAAAQEVSKSLNKVGHFCLNLFATTTFLVALAIIADPLGDKMSPKCVFVFYAAAMWMQLATIRYRKTIPLVLSVLIEIITFAWVAVSTVQMFNEMDKIAIKRYLFPAFFVFITIIRLVCMTVLFKVLMFKTPNYSFSNTVFLKPTNTPVTFSSVLAPQELDPTNPYYPQTVYNNNNLVKNNLLDKSRS